MHFRIVLFKDYSMNNFTVIRKEKPNLLADKASGVREIV